MSAIITDAGTQVQVQLLVLKTKEEIAYLKNWKG